MNRIKELRLKKGLTIKQLSDLSGLSVSSISAYERGTRQPKFDSAERLAPFLEATPVYLVGGAERVDGADATLHHHQGNGSQTFEEALKKISGTTDVRAASASQVNQALKALGIRPFRPARQRYESTKDIRDLARAELQDVQIKLAQAVDVNDADQVRYCRDLIEMIHKAIEKAFPWPS